MGISLSLFLDILLLLIILFPCAPMYLKQKSVSEFGKAFFSSFIFVSIYLVFTIDNIWKILNFDISIFHFLLMSIICSFISLGFEFLIAKIKYKQIKVMNLSSNNLLIYFLVLVFIPIIEEIIFVGYLYLICEKLEINSLFFILLSGISFGINHIIYSKINIITKTIWGIFFALSYILTGNLYISILSHILNNLILLFIGRRKI